MLCLTTSFPTRGCCTLKGGSTPEVYGVCWARHGPTGTIGTNRPYGFAIAELIAADAPSGTTEGRPGLARLIAARGLKVVTFQDWKKIDAAEIARARYGSPREKFTSIDEMLSATEPRCGGVLNPLERKSTRLNSRQ